jgi:hypothetical protein
MIRIKKSKIVEQLCGGIASLRGEPVRRLRNLEVLNYVASVK